MASLYDRPVLFKSVGHSSSVHVEFTSLLRYVVYYIASKSLFIRAETGSARLSYIVLALSVAGTASMSSARLEGQR